MSDVTNLRNYVDDLGTMTGANLDCELWKRKYHEITLIIVKQDIVIARRDNEWASASIVLWS